jgi:hypothetical protein
MDAARHAASPHAARCARAVLADLNPNIIYYVIALFRGDLGWAPATFG